MNAGCYHSVRLDLIVELKTGHLCLELLIEKEIIVSEFDYWDEDFCSDDVQEMTTDEKEDAVADLRCQIDNNKEQNDVLEANLKLLEGKTE